jgi:hypothetical protein
MARIEFVSKMEAGDIWDYLQEKWLREIIAIYKGNGQ